MAQTRVWTNEEDDIIREFWPDSVSADDLRELLPHRSARSMKDRAAFLGVPRTLTAKFADSEFLGGAFEKGEHAVRAAIISKAARGAREALKAMGAV